MFSIPIAPRAIFALVLTVLVTQAPFPPMAHASLLAGEGPITAIHV